MLAKKGKLAHFKKIIAGVPEKGRK